MNQYILNENKEWVHKNKASESRSHSYPQLEFQRITALNNRMYDFSLVESSSERIPSEQYLATVKSGPKQIPQQFVGLSKADILSRPELLFPKIATKKQQQSNRNGSSYSPSTVAPTSVASIQFNSIQQRNAQLEQEKLSLQKEHTVLQKERTVLQTERLLLQKELESLRDRIRLDETERNELKKELAQKTERIDRIIAAYKDEQQKANEELKQYQQRCESSIATLQSNLNESRKKINSLNSNSTNTKNQVQYLQDEFKDLQRRCTWAQQQYAEFRKKCNREKSQLELELKNRPFADIQGASLLRQQYLEDLAECRKMAKNMDNKINELQQKLETTERNNEMAKAANTECNRMLTDSKAAASTDSKAALEESKRALDSVREAKDANAECNRLLNESKQRETEIQKQLSERNQVIDDLNTKLKQTPLFQVKTIADHLAPPPRDMKSEQKDVKELENVDKQQTKSTTKRLLYTGVFIALIVMFLFANGLGEMLFIRSDNDAASILSMLDPCLIDANLCPNPALLRPHGGGNGLDVDTIEVNTKDLRSNKQQQQQREFNEPTIKTLTSMLQTFIQNHSPDPAYHLALFQWVMKKWL